MTAYQITLKVDTLVVADKRTWNDMTLTWDDYTNNWDYYGEISIERYWTIGRIFTETFNFTEAFSKIATIKRTLTDSISHTENIVKNIVRTFSETISHTEIFSRLQTAIRTLTEELTLTDSVMHHLAKNFSDIIAHTESIAKKTVKTIGEALGMTEFFSMTREYVRTLTDTLNILEQDYTWDTMTSTWDDYTENWDYYSPALQIIKILRRTITDSITLTDSISKIVGDFLKNAFGIIGSVSMFGILKSDDIKGSIKSENMNGNIGSQDISGKIKEEQLFGKITKK